ncbi:MULTISPECIES: hypothetical protein [unclassified Streptomyces]|uniref:hypothetical protein n=1 Tax=unclassified Streptomyces TaxID=2593676 RepID=UPI00225A59DF|nr:MULTISPECIES: hypothetical protein [unclassified Streptomyces]WTB59504.1 hypothetical protein OG832_43725 [Streptomyces sp. NBC_00826]WTH96317.1 hypothetical protein OIC43_45950 [Streptomyces sp. NBC_00825]WTI04660.1 hypothetical protein OHA23_43690 [Streptomyces sp. NBC_00822]MCX4870717.1 hypothetical protein [Streptomyces sp. NBC_00906]MCX4901806.1 hypothetical protein [Streptomyces sp. NBC_00892]
MPSVVGLLEQHELAARRRVDGLREEADRIQAELATAEQEWLEWTIARERVGAVLSEPGGSPADVVVTDVPGGAWMEVEVQASPPVAAKSKSQVPVWREGLAWTALSADYQRILRVLADRVRLSQGPLTCQEMAVRFGMDVVPAKVEALRSKAKRLVARGWLAERQPGRFTLARGVSGSDGGS